MRTWFRLVGWVLGVVGGVLGILYVGFFDVWRVPTDDPMMAASIEPTLSAGDLLVVTRRSEPARGQLQRCADPQAPGRYVVARAIGHGGDKLEMVGEVVSIDGKRSPSPRACDPPQEVIHDPRTGDDETLACSVEDYGDTTYGALRSNDHAEAPTRAAVEAGRWFMLSDDRHVHVDSRDYGEIDGNTCQHIVFRVVSAAGFFDAKKRFTIIW
jgi:signal peptidase I